MYNFQGNRSDASLRSVNECATCIVKAIVYTPASYTPNTHTPKATSPLAKVELLILLYIYVSFH